MDDDLDIFDDRMRVEVSVAAGKVSGVTLTTMLEIPKSDRQKSIQTIRDAVNMLRAALPLAELKAEDQAYDKTVQDLGVGTDGVITPVPANLREIRAAQAKLTETFKNEHPEPPVKPEPPRQV